MAIPFALALTVGSYLLLLVVYANLFSLATQCVESAAPSLQHASRLDDFALTMSVFALRCDGVVVDDDDDNPSTRRQWDPGIAEMPLVPTALMSPTETPAQLRRQWDPGTLAPMVLHFALTSPPRVWDPGMLLASMANRFHCCHPVLLRPTVPNVDS